MAMVARMPMITTTISNSMRVKPLCAARMVFLTVIAGSVLQGDPEKKNGAAD
jgi:hypothetical protein